MQPFAHYIYIYIYNRFIQGQLVCVVVSRRVVKYFCFNSTNVYRYRIVFWGIVPIVKIHLFLVLTGWTRVHPHTVNEHFSAVERTASRTRHCRANVSKVRSSFRSNLTWRSEFQSAVLRVFVCHREWKDQSGRPSWISWRRCSTLPSKEANQFFNATNRQCHFFY